MSRTMEEKEQQQTISLLDLETLQKTKFCLIGEQTVAARNDVTAKKVVSGLFQTFSGLPEAGLLAARAISISNLSDIAFLSIAVKNIVSLATFDNSKIFLTNLASIRKCG